nr:MAG TPA: hypothetical protein [Caudoviricetes sp.]
MILKSSDNSYQQVIHNLMWITFFIVYNLLIIC